VGKTLKLAEGAVDDIGAPFVQRFGKKGAEDDVGRDVGHHRINVDRPLPVRSVEPREQIVGCGDHQVHGTAERCVGKGGVDHRALAFPILAIGGKNAVADQRGEISYQFAMFRKSRAAAQDPVHQRQFVGYIHGLTRHADLTELHRIAFLEQDVDPAVPAAHEPLEKATPVARRLGVGRSESFGHGIALKAAMASSMVRRLAVRLI
jgi:hypothetical protein